MFGGGLLASAQSAGILFFFFNDTATTEIYTLSLHDALPICDCNGLESHSTDWAIAGLIPADLRRSEEHTSELQSRSDLVCRLLLEKKKRRKLHGSAAEAAHRPATRETGGPPLPSRRRSTARA